MLAYELRRPYVFTKPAKETNLKSAKLPQALACEVKAAILQSMTPYQFTDPSRTWRIQGFEAAGTDSELEGSSILSFISKALGALAAAEDRRGTEMSGKPLARSERIREERRCPENLQPTGNLQDPRISIEVHGIH